jgi:hypothetical protein
MPANCFIDKKGGVFKRDSLRKATNDLPVIKYKIDTEKILGEAIAWKLENFHDFLVHYERVTNADLNEPLILRSDGFVMDGWHRIVKAILLDSDELPAKQFAIDPEPDYIKTDF